MKSIDETKKSVHKIAKQLNDELSGETQTATPKQVAPIPPDSRKFDETNKDVFRDEPTDERIN